MSGITLPVVKIVSPILDPRSEKEKVGAEVDDFYITTLFGSNYHRVSK